jgi:hypothetical protein
VAILVSEESIKLVRRELRKATDVLVSPEEVVGAIRRILNEHALEEMGAVRISLPERKKRRQAGTVKPAECDSGEGEKGDSASRGNSRQDVSDSTRLPPTS